MHQENVNIAFQRGQHLFYKCVQDPSVFTVRKQNTAWTAVGKTVAVAIDLYIEIKHVKALGTGLV